MKLKVMPQNPYLAIERGAPGRIGWRIHYFDEIDSTQEAARELAASGADQGTLVIAEQQTAGRGRMGRSWHSPSGVNLYTTIILRPPIPLADVPRLSLVAGVAVAEALEREAPGIVALKWPNDLWLLGRKAGGIIAEAVTDARQNLDCVLLGIGRPQYQSRRRRHPARLARQGDLDAYRDRAPMRPNCDRRFAF
jgi:BirA family transcriptional regulator, biotin operon repressor / biotin---[acetyl-CoA-carboxylase] ligase